LLVPLQSFLIEDVGTKPLFIILFDFLRCVLR